MTNTEKLETERAEVWAMGPVPPPVTGMTLLTQAVLQRMQAAGPVVFHNWSHGTQTFTPRDHAVRLRRTLICLGKLLAHGRVKNTRLYLVANSRSGLLLTVVLASAARRLGYRVYLHHHTYGYINTYSRWMAWIDRQMDERCAHVVHCEQMVDDFRRQYPARCQFKTIFPSVVSLEIHEPRTAIHEPLTLGILSNLSIPKGAGLAIDTFRALHGRGRDVRLLLAGTILNSESQQLINSAVAEFPGKVRYIGAVYDAAKIEFFRDIDVLLFPTRYREESWGIVLNEALAAGVPVITFDRGCTRTVVGEGAGLVLPQHADFAKLAAEQIEKWMDSADDYRAASAAAIAQAEYLHREGQSQLDRFAEHMFSTN